MGDKVCVSAGMALAVGDWALPEMGMASGVAIIFMCDVFSTDLSYHAFGNAAI